MKKNKNNNNNWKIIDIESQIRIKENIYVCMYIKFSTDSVLRINYRYKNV